MFFGALNNSWFLSSSWILMASLAYPILPIHKNGGASLNVGSVLNNIRAIEQVCVACSAHIGIINFWLYSPYKRGYASTSLGRDWTFHYIFSWEICAWCKRKTYLLLTVINCLYRELLLTLVFSQALSQLCLRGQVQHIFEHLGFLISRSDTTTTDLACLRSVIKWFNNIWNVRMDHQLLRKLSVVLMLDRSL